MTISELQRALESKARVKKLEAQEKATYDYILAELIGRSVSRIYSKSAKYPAISEVYPSLFDSEELQQKKEERLKELSVLRFKHFAENFNLRFKKG